MTYQFEISVGGPAYGFRYAAHVYSEAPGYDREPCVGLSNDSPEGAAEDARRYIRQQAARAGYSASFTYGREN